jgi:hypothetical protein
MAKMPDEPGGELGHKRNPVYVDVKESWWTIGSVVVALLALAASAWALYITWAPSGEVQPIEPSSYAVLRVDPLVGEVEHLVVPLEWKNDKGRSVLIRSPRLRVCKLGEADKCKEDGEWHIFRLVRDYRDISGGAFAGERYNHKSSLVLKPHSISTNVLAFRFLSVGGEKFQFESNVEYRITIDYFQDTESRRIEPRYLGNFCLKNRTADMILSGNAQWNWWPVDEYDKSCQASA